MFKLPLEATKFIDVYKKLHKDAMHLADSVVELRKRHRKQTLTVSKVRVFYDQPDSFNGTIYEHPQAPTHALQCLFVALMDQTYGESSVAYGIGLCDVMLGSSVQW